MSSGARSVAVLVGLVALGATCVAAQHFPSRATLDSLVQKYATPRGPVGIVLGVMEADGSTTVVSAGTAGADARPIGERTLFEIGSITKSFTGTLLADMAQRGEVSITDPIATHLPDEVRVPSRNGREITLLDLATHHSGLPRLPSNLQPADATNPYVDYTVDQLYAFLNRHELRRDPGAEFEYSNVGVGLLGHALALTAESSYEELVRERILGPLGMSMTGITLEGEMLEWMAQGHNRQRRVVPLWDLPTLAGAGALRSNMVDMLSYLAANIGAPRTPLEEAMRVAHDIRESMNESTSAGLNWAIRHVGDSRIIWHNGGTAGFRTFLGLDPDAEVGVVVLTNSSHGADDLGFHLINAEMPLTPPVRPIEAYAVIAIGLFVIVVGLLGALFPRSVVRVGRRFTGSKLTFAVGVVLRAVVAVILLKSSSSTRLPGLVLFVGGVGLLRAVVLPFIGRTRVEALLERWTELHPAFRGASALVAGAVGTMLVYAGM